MIQDYFYPTIVQIFAFVSLETKKWWWWNRSNLSSRATNRDEKQTNVPDEKYTNGRNYINDNNIPIDDDH